MIRTTFDTPMVLDNVFQTQLFNNVDGIDSDELCIFKTAFETLVCVNKNHLTESWHMKKTVKKPDHFKKNKKKEREK